MRSLITTRDDLIALFRGSVAVTPPKSRLIEAIDLAIKECRSARDASWPPEFNDFCEALEKLHEARSLAAGGR